MPGSGRYLPIDGVNKLLRDFVHTTMPRLDSTIEDDIKTMIAIGHLTTLRSVIMHPLIHMLDAFAAYDTFLACSNIVLNRAPNPVSLRVLSDAVLTISTLCISDDWGKFDRLKRVLLKACDRADEVVSDVDTTVDNALEIALNLAVATVDEQIRLGPSRMVSAIKTAISKGANVKDPHVMWSARMVYRRCVFSLPDSEILRVLEIEFEFTEKDAEYANIDSYLNTDKAYAQSLGKGAFGVVYAVPSADGKLVRAVKITKRTQAEDIVRFVRDYELTRVLHTIRKGSFMKTHCMGLIHDEHVEWPYLPVIVSDLAVYGDLVFVIEKAKYKHANEGVEKLREVSKRIAFATWGSIIPAMRAMHDIGYVHCDIRPRNVFVFEDGIKLCDLDACVDTHEEFKGLFHDTDDEISKRRSLHDDKKMRTLNFIENYINNVPTHGNEWYYDRFRCVYAPERFMGMVDSNDGSALREIDVWSVGHLWYDVCSIVFDETYEPFDRNAYGDFMLFSAFPNDTSNITHKAKMCCLPNNEDMELRDALQMCFEKRGRSVDGIWNIVRRQKTSLPIHYRIHPKDTDKTFDAILIENMNDMKSKYNKGRIVGTDSLNALLFYERTDLDDRMTLSI